MVTISRIQPIYRKRRKKKKKEPATNNLIDELKKEKEALINRFIETSPKLHR
jgi:hypothetical protein